MVGSRIVSALQKAGLCFMLAFMIVFLWHQVAYAEDRGNTVNPHQLPDSSFLYDTSIEDLGTADSYYDGQTVQLVGEVVGDCLTADTEGNYRWITLASPEQRGNDSISVFITKRDSEKIGSFGRYEVVGTTLQVRGTFHLVCPEHEGVTDLHADYVTVIEQGHYHPDTFNLERFVPGIIVVAVGLALMLLYYYMRERRR